MSTLSPIEASNPDTNLVTSFVAMADGVSTRSGGDQSRDTTTTGTPSVNIPTVTTTAVSTTESSKTRDNNDAPSPATPVGENTTTVRATVESTPINEFSDLARILSNAFPTEFPFGVTPEELGSTGSMLKRVLRRLTRVYDGRVAHNYVLLMYIANLMYRHASLAATSARVDQESSAEVVNILNHPEWRERAEIVANNPSGPEAKELIKQISPLVRLAGKKVPWSPMERLSASYHIYAMYHVFGAPAFFITFSPKTLTNQLMLSFGMMQSPDETVDLQLPKHLQHRVKLLTSNTIAQARAYELMLDAVVTVLFGIQPESRSHKTHMPEAGLFGIPTAYYGVTEVQSRNALHAHFVIWLRTMHPDMLQRIAHDDDLRQILVNAVDSVVTASTEHFENCVSQSTVICKFDTKPYGIRYVPTGEWKSVELKSVVWGSRASKFSLTPGMKIVSFAGNNVRNMRSETVRDMIKGHAGPVTIIFERDTMFDPATGELKKPSGTAPMTPHQSTQHDTSVKIPEEVKRCVSSGSVAESFFPPWIMKNTSEESSVGEDAVNDDRKECETPAADGNVDSDSDARSKNDSPDNPHLVSKTPGESDINDGEDSVNDGQKECETVADGNADSDSDSRSKNDFPDSPDLVSNPPGESDINDLDPTKYPLFDNILDQNFTAKRLNVGDVFFDRNNGDACNVDDYTLGWVEVVATHRRSVFLSPIYSPQRPFIPKGVDDVPIASRSDMIDEEYVKTKLSRLPARVLEVIRQRNCWEWDESLANKAAALHRLKVRGQIVMSAYNVHGFANGETQRRHSHRCHKYKDTYKAKWCTLGFGRTVFDETDLRHIISETAEETSNVTDEDIPVDDDVVDSETSKLTEFDKLNVKSLDKPEPPPEDGTRDDRVLCLDLRRKSGIQPTELRQDVKRAVHDTLTDRLCSQVVLVSRVQHRIMSFLCHPEEEHHIYSDQYLCETAPILAALLGCNTNVSPLGGNVQAINALFYLTGYLSKNPVKPTSWIMCIIAALKSTCRWESVAEDVGTPSRNAKFFLQKVLNRLNALAEITDTQAAMLLLGFKSFLCSHRFGFCFHRQALEAQVQLYNAKRTSTTAHSTTSCVDPSQSNDGECDSDRVCTSNSVDDSESDGTDSSTIDDDSDFDEDGTTASDSDDNANDGVDDSESGGADSSTIDDDSNCDEDGTTAFDSDDSPNDGVNGTTPSDTDDNTNDGVDDVTSDTSSEEPVTTGTGNDTRSRSENFNEECPVPAGNIIYRDTDGVAFALSQHHHHLHRVRDWKATLPKCDNGSHTNDLAWWYQHARDTNNPVWRSYQRNKGLHDFTLTEYVRHIEVVDMPDSLPTSGPVKYYLFSRKHPICDSHVQKLRSKHLITALSGRPPRHPGPVPQDRSAKSGISYEKRLLAWKMKADWYGRTMGSIFSPWDEHGDCGVHSYEDFQNLEKDWVRKLTQLRVERTWRQFITRDRTLDDGELVYPPPDLFPDPRFAARRQHAHNLGVNLRVPKQMKRIANKWRYQHSDRFDNPTEYDFINNDGGDMSSEDKENALAIASLLETFSRKQPGAVTGVSVDTADHLDRMSKQMERLYGATTTCVRSNITQIHRDRGLDPDWYRKSLTCNVKWAKDTFKELMDRKPDTGTVTPADGFTTDGLSIKEYDDTLRAQMSPDKVPAFDEAITCFDSNKPLRMFVHGGPGTGKSFLAKCIMKAASARGLVSRFTALSGAAATINQGTTLHYAVGMTKRTKWGSDPTANQIKQIRERNTDMRVLIIDEVSMTHARMLNQVIKHLQHANLWKTLHLITMGDFCQLSPPTQYENALYKDFVLAARKPTSYSSKPLVLAGIRSFQKLRKTELSIQNRAKDPDHMQTIQQLRKGEINDEFINNLKPLTSLDVSHDWTFAPILVTSNAEAILLNKRQIVEFAEAHNQFVLRWTNPIRNCEDSQSYDINIVEGIIPEAVQYFCMGAPAFVNANKNPVGTGIVNGYRVLLHSLIWKDKPWRGPDKGWKPGQIFEVHRPTYMVVIKDPDVKTNKNDAESDDATASEVDSDNTGPDLIPLRTDHYQTWTQGVQIKYTAFPLDLRFAITYHKVQGQTMDKVILFLHERKTKQLAPLQWESLYVAYTRVKYGDGIRVCYFGSDDPSDRSGLKHLRKLRRPKLYDVWQSAYDDQGMWNDTELRKQAKSEQEKLCRKLRRVTSISQVSLKKLKAWADILDVDVAYKPGTKRKNKPQYVEAITPIWVGINGGVLTSESDKTTEYLSRRYHSRPSAGPGQSNRQQQHKHGASAASTPLNRRNRQRNDRVSATPPRLNGQQRRNSLLARSELQRYHHAFRSRTLAKAGMHKVVYCMNLEYVDQVSRWSAYALATPGEFINDTVIYYFGSHFCRSSDNTTKAWVVDPILPLGSRALLSRGIRDKYVERLQVRGETLLFPINAPAGVHWMLVLVWLNDSGRLTVQCRNSMNAYSRQENGCCTNVETFINTLYDDESNIGYPCPGFVRSVPVSWTQQTAGVHACGLHVLSHIYLTSKGLAHTHTFDNAFVEEMRKYCVQSLYENRCNRRTTRMRPIDLTQDNPNPRFKLL